MSVTGLRGVLRMVVTRGGGHRCSFAWLTPLAGVATVLDEDVVDQAGGPDAGRHGDEHAAVDGARAARSVSGSTSARYSGSTPPQRGAARPARDRARRRARRPRPRRAAARSARRSAERARAVVRRRGGRCGDESARPSGSRTVGTTSIATGMSRSRTIRRSDGDLLGVLLAEVGDVGRDDVEQLGDDGADAGEVPRAALGALEHVAEARDADRRGEPVGVDLLRRAGRTARRRRAPRRSRRRAASVRG